MTSAEGYFWAIQLLMNARVTKLRLELWGKEHTKFNGPVAATSPYVKDFLRRIRQRHQVQSAF